MSVASSSWCALTLAAFPAIAAEQEIQRLLTFDQDAPGENFSFPAVTVEGYTGVTGGEFVGVDAIFGDPG